MTRPNRVLPSLLVARLTLLAAAGGALPLLVSCEKPVEAAKPPPIDASKYVVDATPFQPKGVAEKTAPKVTFADATPDSGLAFSHVNGAQGKKYLPETMGAGVVVFDFDGDGKLDVYCVQGAEWPGSEKLPKKPTGRLFKNLGGMKFQDVTEGSGLDVPFLGMGGCAADYDGDGDVDLFVTALGPYHLFRNEGGGHFTDVAKDAGLVTTTWKDKQGREHPSWSTSAAWLDYDGDGILDLFVCHYVHWSTENDVFESMNGTDKAYAQPVKYESDSCRLFRGTPDCKFVDVTKEAGIEKSDSKSLGIAVADLDGDGRPEIAIANDTQPNYLFQSQKDGKYVDVAPDAGMAKDGNGRARAGMGIDMASLLNDGRYTVSIGNFSGEPVSMYTQIGKELFFVDQAGRTRIGPATELPLKFAVLFCDYDLDGLLDVFALNGHIEPTIESVRKDTTYEEAPQLFWNRGDGMFAEVSKASGDCMQKRLVGRGAAAADLDGDGDLDLVVTQNGRPALLFRNDQSLGNGWLRTRLQGSGRNRDALGATVTLEVGGKPITRDVRTGSSYLSQCDVAPTFGLGANAKEPVAVVVKWPSGKRERFEGLAPNHEHQLVEGKGKAQ
jgi:hypothetical protein